MADRCAFLDELLALPEASSRLYILHERAGTGLACVEARLRRRGDWYFARRWVRTAGGPRELYRVIDRLEAAGFRFRVSVGSGGGPPQDEVRAAAERLGELRLRASELRAGLTADERHIHAELFPEEDALLARGYDWDSEHVYRGGARLRPDPFGRILEVDGDVLYEWVHVADELTWRRYPLERVRRIVTAPGT